jgi:hypothetical protein
MSKAKAKAKAKEYRAFAEECDRLAAAAHDPDAKIRFHELVRRWRELEIQGRRGRALLDQRLRPNRFGTSRRQSNLEIRTDGAAAPQAPQPSAPLRCCPSIRAHNSPLGSNQRDVRPSDFCTGFFSLLRCFLGHLFLCLLNDLREFLWFDHLTSSCGNGRDQFGRDTGTPTTSGLPGLKCKVPIRQVRKPNRAGRLFPTHVAELFRTANQPSLAPLLFLWRQSLVANIVDRASCHFGRLG